MTTAATLSLRLAGERRAQERRHLLLGPARLGQHRLEHRVVEHVGQPVGAEQVHVAGPHPEAPHRDADRLFHPEGARHHVAGHAFEQLVVDVRVDLEHVVDELEWSVDRSSSTPARSR